MNLFLIRLSIFGTFNKGKDLEDLMDWYDDFADWTDDQGDTWDSMTVAILRPQYSSDLSSHDFMWVNTWPTPTAQFAALENWATDDDAIDLFSDIPITNTAVVDTWQWTVSEPAALEAGMVMYAAYSECYLEEGVTLIMSTMDMLILQNLLKKMVILLEESL